jgi:hypothetical protein
MICNFATAILLNDNWNPDKIQAPHQNEFPPPRFLPDDVPFREGKELIIDLPMNDKVIQEIFIDDLISLGIYLPNTNNCPRLEQAPHLAMDVCAHRKGPDEPIPIQDMAAHQKLTAKAPL